MDKKKKALRLIVKEVLSVLREMELNEATTTGNVAGYNTPNAFSGEGDKEKKKDRLIDKDYEFIDDMEEELKQSIELAENRWLDLKKDDSRNSNRKIADQTSAIRKELADIRKRMRWCSRIRNENDIGKDQFFSRTKKNLEKMSPIIDDIRKLAKEFKL